jgi:hypothetical protein
MSAKNSHKGRRFTQGSPTKDQRGMSKLGEPPFSAFGQACLSQSHCSEEELLREAVRLEPMVPIPKTMAFALEDTKQRAEIRSNSILRLGGEVDSGRKGVVEPVGTLEPEDFFEICEVVEGVRESAGT